MKKNLEKKLKVIKILSIILLTILVIQLVYFGITYYKNRNNYSYFTIVNDITLNNNSNIGVGYSDFKHSKLNKKTEYNKAVIWKYDNNFEVLEEKPLDLGLTSYYNDVIEIEDGYIAIGAIEMTQLQHEENITEGLIVRYDKELNIVWRENIQVLDDTELFKVKLDKDNNLIIVGQSIYAENIIGNQTTGGALLFKYDLDGKELLRINYGGPQTGAFNDVYIENDGYVVVGVTKSETGIIQKYDFKGNEIWHNYYGPTESNGLTNIYKDGNNYLVTGTLLPAKNDTSSYKAVIVKFNQNGQKINEIFYEKERLNIFRNLYVDKDYIYAVGTFASVKDNEALTDAFVIKYDKKFNIVDEQTLILEKSESYNKIYKTDNEFIILGFTNSKSKTYKTNGYDYYPIFIKY